MKNTYFKINVNNEFISTFGVTYIAKIALFAAIVFTFLFAKNLIVTLLLLTFICLIDSRYLLISLIFFPLTETVLLVYSNFTISKLIAIYFAVFSSISILKRGRVLNIKEMMPFLLFLIILIFGLFLSMLNVSAILTTDSDYFSTLLNFLIVHASRVIISLLLVQYLYSRGLKYFYEIIKLGVDVLPLAILCVCIYFIFGGHYEEFNWYNVIRLSLENADPNEFSCIMASLSCFCLANLGFHNIFRRLYGISSFSFAAYSIFLTLSRAGVIVLCAALMCYSYLLLKANNKLLLVAFILSIILGLLILPKENIESVFYRFNNEHINDINELTTNRYQLWCSGFESFLESPVIGYGDSDITPIYINKRNVMEGKVMHNLYIEILTRYGVIGFIAFFYILYLSFIGLSKIKIYNRDYNCFILYTPNIVLLLLLLSGFSLSWEWREIIWYFIGICYSLRLIAREAISGELFPKKI